MLLLGLLLVQLGPACGFANAAFMDSMQCCQTRCPAHSSRIPANCCRILASPDKAKVTVGALPQPALLGAFGHNRPVVIQSLSEVSFVTYRSPAPPPQRTFDLLCSRQI